jgi:hypothetical protein
VRNAPPTPTLTTSSPTTPRTRRPSFDSPEQEEHATTVGREREARYERQQQ